MEKYLLNHSYINENKECNNQFELSEERAKSIACKCENIVKQQLEKQRSIIDEILNFTLFENDCPLSIANTKLDCCESCDTARRLLKKQMRL